MLRKGGRFVFSVNVPEPKWWKVGLFSMGDMFRAGRPVRFIKRGTADDEVRRHGSSARRGQGGSTICPPPR